MTSSYYDKRYFVTLFEEAIEDEAACRACGMIHSLEYPEEFASSQKHVFLEPGSNMEKATHIRIDTVFEVSLRMLLLDATQDAAIIAPSLEYLRGCTAVARSFLTNESHALKQYPHTIKEFPIALGQGFVPPSEALWAADYAFDGPAPLPFEAVKDSPRLLCERDLESGFKIECGRLCQLVGHPESAASGRYKRKFPSATFLVLDTREIARVEVAIAVPVSSYLSS
jgi:hypothetical protein